MIVVLLCHHISISIHALLAESDTGNMTLQLKDGDISIHALLAESDHRMIVLCMRPQIFLSTLSLRRATTAVCPSPAWTGYFYPRSPCGERPAAGAGDEEAVGISIHALLAESDPCAPFQATAYTAFLSTLSLRRATVHGRPVVCFLFKFLSTLSLRRATIAAAQSLRMLNNFYPRSPCGERLRILSTSRAFSVISIHALLAESDSKSAQNSGALLRI